MKDGWAVEPLGQVAEVTAGQSPEGVYYNTSGEGLPFYQGKKEFGERFIGSPTTWTSKTTKVAAEGDVLMSVRAPVGPVNFATEMCCIGRGLAAIRSHDELDKDFLFYFLLSKQEEISGTEGAVFASINKSDIQKIPIPVPLPVEQQRMIAILDEAFEDIATARANAEKSLQGARAILVDRLRFLFSTGSEDWVPTTVGDQLTLQRGFDITKSQQKPGPIPVVSSGGVRSFHDAAMAEGPGVVIGRKGTLGKVFFLESDYWPHDTTLWVKDFKGNRPRLVYYFFLSLDVKGLDSGTANPALNRNQVHPIKTMWPRAYRQDAVVAQLNALNVNSQRLAETYRRKLAALDELKSSLLHEAFSGNL